MATAGVSRDSSGVSVNGAAPVLGRTSPEVITVLERLDDLVFDAIGGNRPAWEQLQVVWAETLRRLGPEVVAESREQYIRHALSVWRDNRNREDLADPAAAAYVLDVICLLIDSD